MSTAVLLQYPLAFATGAPPSFDNFVTGANRGTVDAVRASASGRGDRFLYLAGASGTGKTHLLIAAARAVGGFYLDPAEPGVGPRMTERLEASRVVCLDGIAAAAGRPDWERALFRLFYALESAGTPLLVADRVPPRHLGLGLPDLASRLASGPMLRLAPLDESELRRMLVARARERGFDLSPRVAGYLVTRERRDVRHLLALLDRLDRDSLAAHRPVTIPFVRSLLARPDSG